MTHTSKIQMQNNRSIFVLTKTIGVEKWHARKKYAPAHKLAFIEY